MERIGTEPMASSFQRGSWVADLTSPAVDLALGSGLRDVA
jgi:hypothetical protein